MNISDEELKKIFEREFNRVWSAAFQAGVVKGLLEAKRLVEEADAAISQKRLHGNN